MPRHMNIMGEKFATSVCIAMTLLTALRTDTGGGIVFRAIPVLNRIFILFHPLNTCIPHH